MMHRGSDKAFVLKNVTSQPLPLRVVSKRKKRGKNERNFHEKADGRYHQNFQIRTLILNKLSRKLTY